MMDWLLYLRPTPFTREEINRVVRIMPVRRAPGQTIQWTFFKECWHITKHDFYSFCKDFSVRPQ
jgi:hypothetical protein